MAERVKINRSLLVAQKLPERGERMLLDSDVKGFCARLTPGGISFIVRKSLGKGWKGSVKRTIGRFPDWTPEDARKEAAKMAHQMEHERLDPLAVKKEQERKNEATREKTARTFGKVYAEWMAWAAEHPKKNRAETVAMRKKIGRRISGVYLDKHGQPAPGEHPPALKLWALPFGEITAAIVARDLVPLFKQQPATAWQILRCGAAASSWETDKRGGRNPFRDWRTDSGPEDLEARDTALDLDTKEGGAWLRALVALREDATHGLAADYLLLLFLWCSRRFETRMLERRDLDEARGLVHFRKTITKNRKPHARPLTPWAAQIIRERLAKNPKDCSVLFPSPTGSGRPFVEFRDTLTAVNEAAGVKVRAHDLRRTASTELSQAAGARFSLIRIALGHSAGKGAITAQYIRDQAELLRPLMEARERRLRVLASLDKEPETVPPDLLVALAAADPKMQQKIARLLKLSTPTNQNGGQPASRSQRTALLR